MKLPHLIKKILHIKDDATPLAKKLDQHITILKSLSLILLLIDKNRRIIEAYNTDQSEKIGIPAGRLVVGKHLHQCTTDQSPHLCQLCNNIEEAIDKTFQTGAPVVSEYKNSDTALKITVSIIHDQNILVQIKDITKLVQRLNEMEFNSNKELSMALTAGGLTSWSYDVKTQILSSSHQNNTIGEQTTLEEMLHRTQPEHVPVITKMFDDIINRRIEKSEITVRNTDLQGNIQWTNVHAIAQKYTPHGEVAVIAGSQKNITAEYEFNQEIKHLIKQNDLIMNNMSSALVYVASDFRVIWENVSKVFQGTKQSNYYKKGTYCYTSFNRDTPCENCVMQQAIHSRKSMSQEHTSESSIVEITANPIIGKNNEIEGVVMKIDNITEKKEIIQNLKKAEQEASATNKLLYTILDNLPCSIFVKDVDDDYRYIISNKLLCEKLGLPEKEVTSKTDYQIFPTKEEADKYRSDDIDTIENNQTKILNGEEVTMKDNIMISYTIKTPLINVDQNNKRLLVGISMDITESHKAYQELAAAKKKAEESDRLKSAFLANMSHEIRTPLNAIVGFSELMQSCDDPEEKAEYMRIISTNNELLLRLINDILDLSKLDSGIAQLHISQFDLAQFFNELSATMRQRITNPDIEFITRNPYQSCIIETDKTRMVQVWTNFMTNAIKYTVSGHIKMGYEYVNEGIKLYVEDTGIGISDDKKVKLFQRFEKLDTFAQGTGLGLSICKAISELGGGEIGFESEEGKGSLFWSWKPLKATIIHKTSCNESIFAEAGSKLDITDVEKCLKGRNCKILVAEDIDNNYLLVKSILKEFDVSRAINGAEAVEKVKQEHYDIVLMDMKMPVMDGIQATREIRKFNNQITIIALTAHTSGSNKQEALNAGCNHFLTKPTSKTKLFQAFTLM